MILETSLSLLQRLRQNPDPGSWQRFVYLYSPLLRDWLRHTSVQPEDVEDLLQDVFSVLVKELPQFAYTPERGRFRGWLRAILANRLRAFYRARQARLQATGAGDFERLVEQLEDPRSDLSRLWDQEHDRHVLAQPVHELDLRCAGQRRHAHARGHRGRGQVFPALAHDLILPGQSPSGSVAEPAGCSAPPAR